MTIQFRFDSAGVSKAIENPQETFREIENPFRE